ncbi:hypothetical protein ACJX0J_007079 [Zea mays]
MTNRKKGASETKHFMAISLPLVQERDNQLNYSILTFDNIAIQIMPLFFHAVLAEIDDDHTGNTCLVLRKYGVVHISAPALAVKGAVNKKKTARKLNNNINLINNGPISFF